MGTKVSTSDFLVGISQDEILLINKRTRLVASARD